MKKYFYEDQETFKRIIPFEKVNSIYWDFEDYPGIVIHTNDKTIRILSDNEEEQINNYIAWLERGDCYA